MGLKHGRGQEETLPVFPGYWMRYLPISIKEYINKHTTFDVGLCACYWVGVPYPLQETEPEIQKHRRKMLRFQCIYVSRACLRPLVPSQMTKLLNEVSYSICFTHRSRCGTNRVGITKQRVISDDRRVSHKQAYMSGYTTYLR